MNKLTFKCTSITHTHIPVPPSAPVGLTVENRTDTTVSLRWQEPASAGGGSSLEYNLFFQTPGVDSRSLFGTVSETEGLITGLSPFLSYTLSVSSETSVSGEIPEMLFSERSANITVAESQSGEYILRCMTTLHLIMGYTNSNTCSNKGNKGHFSVCYSLSYMYVWPSVSEDLFSYGYLCLY
jgi:hypothetical protein